MNKQYEHTQVGYFLIVTIITVLIVIGIIMAYSDISWIAVGVIVIIAAALALFHSLTVVIWEKELEVRFGPGIIRKRFRLNEIESFEAVKSPWYYGWGIRSTPQGTLFRVSGFNTVAIRLKTGKAYFIGTDVPRELEEAIRKATNLH